MLEESAAEPQRKAFSFENEGSFLRLRKFGVGKCSDILTVELSTFKLELKERALYFFGAGLFLTDFVGPATQEAVFLDMGKTLPFLGLELRGLFVEEANVQQLGGLLLGL